ncbi:hypothetical protein [Maribellus mangrovi]|uniref:hypothetical protein n=1 Tax=Maribellus mangrovi TaxID=3133146 RepID=UPI0030EDC96D
MARKIVTKGQVDKINQEYDKKKKELISSLLTEAEQITTKRGGIKKSEEEIAAEAKMDTLIAEIGSKPTEKEDTYSDRLMKYIPAEIIALYLTFDTIIRSAQTQPDSIGVINWIIFFFCFLAIILVLVKKDNVKSLVQISISLGAFIVWIFALGGPFKETFDWYRELYGALLLPAYTFLVPFITPAD